MLAPLGVYVPARLQDSLLLDQSLSIEGCSHLLHTVEMPHDMAPLKRFTLPNIVKAPVQAASLHKPLAPEAALQLLGTSAHSWEFDVFGLEAACEGHGPSCLAEWLFDHQGLFTALALDQHKLRLFLKRVEAG